MNKTIYEVKSVHLSDFNPKETNTKIIINYTKNNEPHQIIKQITLNNPVAIVNNILVTIKSKDKMIIEESDDFLSNIFITRIKDEERIEEKLLYYFQDLTKKIKELKAQKIATKYMHLYNQLKISKLILEE